MNMARKGIEVRGLYRMNQVNTGLLVGGSVFSCVFVRLFVDDYYDYRVRVQSMTLYEILRTLFPNPLEACIPFIQRWHGAGVP